MFKLPFALRRDQAAFKQDRAQLVDQRRPLTDQPVPGSVKRLHVELILALQSHKAHRRPRRSLRDPLSVAIIVLLRLDVRADIFGRHQPNLMIMGGEQPAQMMSPAARLHPDDARRKLRHKSYQRLAPNLTPHHDRTRRVEPDDAVDILAKIDTKHCNIHFRSSFCTVGDPTTPVRGAGHSIKHERALSGNALAFAVG